ncbi:preprotein translocase subunit SecY [Mycoplasmatota bacterium]|nr:preprotein translocase subunit SecY [Mycoplasmatota bacterium]
MLRIAFTLMILLFVRILANTTIPLVEVGAVVDYIQSSDYFAILNSFSGQSLQNLSIMSLGVTPYITASIAVQLLQMVIPKLKEFSEQGETGKQKLNKITRYMALGLAFIQALALIMGLSTRGSLLVTSLEASVADQYRYLFYVYMALVMASGTALAMWFASLITKKGVGNGTSMLIVAGIVTSLPTMMTVLWEKYIIGATGGWSYVWFAIIILLYFGILFGVVFMQIAQRKIPIQYANRQGKSDSNIPMKLNVGGVIPVIFAQTIMSIPLSIIGAIDSDGTSSLSSWFYAIFSSSEPIGYILYVVLIVIFAFFYAFLQINPQKMSDNLSKSNSYIPGVRPGIDTQDYIASLLFKISVIGTTYLVLLASLPIFTAAIFGFTSSEASIIRLGGTSLLIIVGVAIETTQQVETDASQNEYGSIFR